MKNAAEKPRIALVVTREKPVPAAASLYFQRWRDGVDPVKQNRTMMMVGRWSRKLRRFFTSSSHGVWS